MIYAVIAYKDSLLDRWIIKIDIDRLIDKLNKSTCQKHYIENNDLVNDHGFKNKITKIKFFWGFFCTKQGSGSVKFPKHFPFFYCEVLKKISP